MNARELARQTTRAGAAALPVATLGGALVGAAIAATSREGGEALAWLARRGPAAIGPITAALCVAAPIGARMAGDVATLRAGDTLLWLRASGHSALRHVALPRILAALLVLPLAALLCSAALFGAASLVAAPRGAAATPLAAVTTSALGVGSLAAAGFGAALATAACAVGFATRTGVARAASRGAAAALLVVVAIGACWIAGRMA
jgi:phospholipid/cholesterol/gamma-HCH transport system permease protein